MKTPILIATLIIAGTAPALTETSHQPYKGYENRKVSSLSQQDIEELQKGGGWGLALPAELNGYPGPAHVLEMQAELGLTPSQVRKMQALYHAMKTEAVALGKKLIQAERDLDQGFKNGDISPAQLHILVAAAETARADLRYLHLSTHLTSVDLLSSDQISTYFNLRGYESDPCQSIPDGHNPEMWRKHTGCTDN